MTAGKDGYIPARKAELIEAIRAESGDMGGLGDVLRLLAALMHHEAHGALETLKALYDPLDPDAAAARRNTAPAAFAAFQAALIEVLRKANFQELDPDTVETRTTTKALTGLQIKASLAGIRSIRFFGRGAHPDQVEIKTWLGLGRKTVEANVMRDVVVIVGFKSEDEIERDDRKAFAAMRRGVRPGAALVKHFRNVAGAELVTLHPGAKPSMRPRDQVLLAAPALAGGVPILFNIWPAVSVLFAVLAAYFAAPGIIDDAQLRRALVAVSGLVAVGAFIGRQWMKYERQTLKYQKQLADTVYFRNLANNAGVLDLLVSEGENQDVKEAFLAYWALLKAGAPTAKADIDARAEAFLRERLGLGVDFEIQDALAKLDRLGLVTREGERYAAVSIAEARARLDATWDGLFNFAPAGAPAS